MAKSKYKIVEIELESIDEPGAVQRLEIDQDELQELQDSIREIGLLQPILLRPKGDRYEIVAGHRRYLAFTALKKKTISSIIRELDDTLCAISRATENLRRTNLSPLEEAAVYDELLNQHGVSISDIGRRMGKSAGVVRRRLDLLKMPPSLQKAIHRRQIAWSVGEVLWSLGNTEAIDYYLQFAIENGATQAVVRGWVKDWNDAQRRQPTVNGEGSPYANPQEPRPTFVTCDLCQGPTEVGTETVLRICPGCKKAIYNAMNQQE